MKKIIFIILLVVFFIQFAFFPFALASLNIKPNLVLAFVFACSLVFGTEVLLSLSIVGGILLDFFSIQVMGTLLVPTLVISIGLRILAEKIISDKKNYLLLFLVFISANLFYNFLAVVINKTYTLIGVQEEVKTHLEANTAPFWLRSVIFALTAMFFFFVADKIHKKFVRDRIEIGIK